jgi:glucose-6-phosphate 1-epimerase
MPSQPDPSRYTIPGIVSLRLGAGDLPYLAITTNRAEAHVYLHGAHVTHYQPRDASHPVLWMSGKSYFEPGKPIRGGVPLVFPWFGPRATDKNLPAHGFARTQSWTLVGADHSEGIATVTLALSANDATRKLWPHEFDLRYTATVRDALELSLQVRNTSDVPFTFEEALHTYLNVGDVRRIELDGLSGRPFIDKMDHATRKTQSGPIRFEDETDRVYVETRDDVTVRDELLRRSVLVSKGGSLATVVWNPWTEKARRMVDYGDDEWPGMVCVETANCADHPVTLQPGETHRMWTVIGCDTQL